MGTNSSVIDVGEWRPTDLESAIKTLSDALAPRSRGSRQLYEDAIASRIGIRVPDADRRRYPERPNDEDGPLSRILRESPEQRHELGSQLLPQLSYERLDGCRRLSADQVILGLGIAALLLDKSSFTDTKKMFPPRLLTRLYKAQAAGATSARLHREGLLFLMKDVTLFEKKYHEDRFPELVDYVYGTDRIFGRTNKRAVRYDVANRLAKDPLVSQAKANRLVNNALPDMEFGL